MFGLLLVCRLTKADVVGRKHQKVIGFRQNTECHVLACHLPLENIGILRILKGSNKWSLSVDFAPAFTRQFLTKPRETGRF